MNTTVAKLLVSAAVAIVLGLGAIGLFFGMAAARGWRAATMAGNEAATIQNLKTIHWVELNYFERHKKNFGRIEELVKDQLLSSKFSGDPATADGYILRITTSGSSYVLTADPQDFSSGRRHFYLDSRSNRIRVSSDRRAAATDPFLND